MFRQPQTPAERVIKSNVPSQPTWGVQQPGHPAEVGDILFAVFSAAGDGTDLVHGGTVDELCHRILFWAVAYHCRLHL